MQSVEGDVVFTFIYTDTFVIGFFASLALGLVWLVHKRRGRGNLHSISRSRGFKRYTVRHETLDYDDLETIVASLKGQFLHHDIEAIIAIDEGGYIVGKLLASELKMNCYQVSIRTRNAKGNANELETPTHKSYLGNLKPTRFAVLVDLDPDEKRMERVAARMKASFPESHTYHKAFIAVTKKQLGNLRKSQTLPLARRQKPAIWAVRAPEKGLGFPWS